MEVKLLSWPALKNDGGLAQCSFCRAIVISLRRTRRSSVWKLGNLSFMSAPSDLLHASSSGQHPGNMDPEAPVASPRPVARWRTQPHRRANVPCGVHPPSLGRSVSIADRTRSLEATLHLSGAGSARYIALIELWKDRCPNMIQALIPFCLMARKRSDLHTRFVQPDMRRSGFLGPEWIDFDGSCWAWRHVNWVCTTVFWTHNFYFFQTFYMVKFSQYRRYLRSVLKCSWSKVLVTVKVYPWVCGQQFHAFGHESLSLLPFKICSSHSNALPQSFWIALHRSSPFFTRNGLDCGIHRCDHLLDGVKACACHHFLELCKHPEVTWWQIRTVSGMGDTLNSVVSEPVHNNSCIVCWCVVMQNDPVLTMSRVSTAHSFFQGLHDLKIDMSVDSCSVWHPLFVDRAIPVKEQDKHGLLSRLFNVHFLQSVILCSYPLLRSLLAFWLPHPEPTLVTCYHMNWSVSSAQHCQGSPGTGHMPESLGGVKRWGTHLDGFFCKSSLLRRILCTVPFDKPTCLATWWHVARLSRCTHTLTSLTFAGVARRGPGLCGKSSSPLSGLATNLEYHRFIWETDKELPPWACLIWSLVCCLVKPCLTQNRISHRWSFLSRAIALKSQPVVTGSE